jgi:hypothetical protein
MALGSAGLSGTGGSHDLYVPEIWSKRIQAAFEKNTVAKEHALDMSDLLTEMGGDIIRVPKLANRTAATRTLTSFAQVTPTGATESQFSMNVQTWKIDPEFISDALPAQTKLFQKQQVDGKMQRSLAEAFDTDLFANYSSLTVTKGTDDAATPAGPDDIFNALEALDTAYVPKSDRVIILTPKTYWGFVKNNVIPSGDYTSNMAKESGRIAMIGGVPVIMSQNLPTTAAGSKVNLVLHKEALVFAIAQAARVRSQQTLDHLGETLVADMLYGTGCYRAEAGVQVFGL